MAAIERGFVQEEIEASAFRYQGEIETGERVVVGVNAFTEEDAEPVELLQVDPEVERRQRERTARVRAERDDAAASSALEEVTRVASSDENLLPAMREALRAGRRFLAADAWKDWIVEEFGASANATSDADIDAYVRANALVVNHVSGTVAMGKQADAPVKGAGAVNPDLTVKGVKGLRVIDASVFVRSVSHAHVPSLLSNAHHSKSR